MNYLRKIHPSQDFFKQSEETIRAKGINARINSTKKELSLKIASKRSNRSTKIYDVGRQGEFLKFEMEIPEPFVTISIIVAALSMKILQFIDDF